MRYFDRASFARWALADVNSNLKRSLLAEYIVHTALETGSTAHEEWGSHDVTYAGMRIEVKSSGFGTPPFIAKTKPVPKFDIRQRTHAWSNAAGEWSAIGEPQRHCDAYVFAVTLATTEHDFSPYDTGQWTFVVAATSRIDAIFGSQKTVSLPALEKHFSRCDFEQLKSCVDNVYIKEPK